jgi:hypothetical protein
VAAKPGLVLCQHEEQGLLVIPACAGMTETQNEGLTKHWLRSLGQAISRNFCSRRGYCCCFEYIRPTKAEQSGPAKEIAIFPTLPPDFALPVGTTIVPS